MMTSARKDYRRFNKEHVLPLGIGHDFRLDPRNSKAEKWRNSVKIRWKRE